MIVIEDGTFIEHSFQRLWFYELWIDLKNAHLIRNEFFTKLGSVQGIPAMDFEPIVGTASVGRYREGSVLLDDRKRPT